MKQRRALKKLRIRYELTFHLASVPYSRSLQIASIKYRRGIRGEAQINRHVIDFSLLSLQGLKRLKRITS